jgi:hypothetical protein
LFALKGDQSNFDKYFQPTCSPLTTNANITHAHKEQESHDFYTSNKNIFNNQQSQQPQENLGNKVILLFQVIDFV